LAKNCIYARPSGGFLHFQGRSLNNRPESADNTQTSPAVETRRSGKTGRTRALRGAAGKVGARACEFHHIVSERRKFRLFFVQSEQKGLSETRSFAPVFPKSADRGGNRSVPLFFRAKRRLARGAPRMLI
jgi:hypothetical protein